MATHHYLPFRGLVGRSLRHVAVLGEHWLALIGWHAGAFKLKARDRWIGWLPEQQFRRLHLIANNARFVILPGCSVPNLGSRVLALSVRRLSEDMRAAHGHRVLLAETFVDRSRFTGACYRAANWQVLGQTQGFARKPGTPATWGPHGRPKEVLVYPLARDAREQLRALDDAPAWRSQGDPEPWTTSRLRSLFECLRTVPEFRGTRGGAIRGHDPGHRGGREARRIPWHQSVRGVCQHIDPAPASRPSGLSTATVWGRFTAPTTTAFFNVLVALDPDVLDRAARTWAAQQNRGNEPVAHRRQTDPRRRPPQPRRQAPPRRRRGASVRESARAGSGRAQEQRDPGRSDLDPGAGPQRPGRDRGRDACAARHRPVRGRAVRRALRDDRGQIQPPNLLIDLAGLDWERPEVRATEHRTANKGHGRIEKRSCRVLDLTDHPDTAPLPHRTVAFRIERERRNVNTGKVEHETVHGLTSLPPEQATAEVVLALVRGHWSIENRLHHVRDVSYHEDRCRVRTGHLPRNLACLTNLAISIVRVQGRFQFLPQAHRHYARRPHDAVRQLLEPPKR